MFYLLQNLKVFLDSFPHAFHDTCYDIQNQHLTEDRIQLHLPKNAKSSGYKLDVDKIPCEVSLA